MSSPAPTTEKVLLSPETVRDLLDFPSTEAVYKAVERGQLPGVTHIGRRLRFQAEAIYALGGKGSKSASR